MNDDAARYAAMRRFLNSALPAAVFIGGLLSCTNVGDPALRNHQGTEFVPPAAYAVWWQMTEACSGRQGDLGNVRWLQASTVADPDNPGQSVLAYWSARDNTVVLTSNARTNGPVVRHEMLHALIGTSAHARAEFLDRCGGVVSCAGECLVEAGPGPEPAETTPRVAPGAMTVTATIAPLPPATSLNDGYFSVTVRVRNPASHPVVVLLPPSGSSENPVSFSYVIRRSGLLLDGDFGSVRAMDSGVTSFAAGETKLHVFDFFIDDAGAPGTIPSTPRNTYIVTAAYGGQAAAQQTILIQ